MSLDMSNPARSLSVGLLILVPCILYYTALWYYGRQIKQSRSQGKLLFDPGSYHFQTVKVGGQYTYLDNDRYEDYFWVKAIDQRLGLIQVSFSLNGDPPLDEKRWTHAIPADQAFHPEDLARTRLGALLNWINSARRAQAAVERQRSGMAFPQPK